MQLEEAKRKSIPPPNVNRSLRRFVMAFIEGDARSYLVDVYNMLIAAVEANSTTRNHTLPCREWLDLHSIEQFNVVQTSGRLKLQNGRLFYDHRLGDEVQRRFNVQLDAVLDKYRTATQITNVNRIYAFQICLSRAYFEREFLLSSSRDISYLDDREASHLICAITMCVSIMLMLCSNFIF